MSAPVVGALEPASAPLPVPRALALEDESAFAIAHAAATQGPGGRPVVPLHLGEPDWPTPDHVIEAGLRAVRRGDTRYAPPAGLPPLRHAIAGELQRLGAPTTPQDVVVTPGGKAALALAFAAVVGEGTEVLIPDPGFPAYAALTRLLGGIPRPYPVAADGGDGGLPDAVAAACTPASRVLVLNSPHNPTGTALDYAGRERLAALAERRGLTVISDEVYRAFQYDGDEATLAAVPGLARRTLVVDSFSKTYAMTGWRIGYVAGPPAFAEVLPRLAAHQFSCTATPVQHAALAALEGPRDHLARVRDDCAARTARAAAALAAIPGVRCPRPAGAFYVFPDVSGTGWPAESLADHLLRHRGVALLPGSGFGAGGRDHLRLSCAAAPAHLWDGVSRLARVLGRAA